jgi:threonine dehydrogenase-like Zn-dependent dehydrogenase
LKADSIQTLIKEKVVIIFCSYKIKRMKAIFLKDGKLDLLDVPHPVRAKDEALIRVQLAGVCNTDLELVKGYMNFNGIIGHEFVGTVEDCDDSSLKGKRVTGEINAGCGRCELCLGGDPRHCANRNVLGISGLNGAFAQYLVLPERNLSQIPDSISDEDAVLVEPLAAAMQILTQIEIKKEYKVLVIGDGKLGILISLALRTTLAKLSLSGHHTERNREMFPDIEHIALEDNPSVAACFDVIVEASGSLDGLKNAVRYIKPLGIIVLKSTFHGDASFDTSLIVVNEIKIIGSRCGRFLPAINALSTGKIRIPKGYITKSFSLENGLEAIKYAGKKGILKVLVKP